MELIFFFHVKNPVILSLNVEENSRKEKSIEFTRDGVILSLMETALAFQVLRFQMQMHSWGMAPCAIFGSQMLLLRLAAIKPHK